ncbi:poly glycohydrolase domain-containing protein [Trichoderma austrokoningii]
MAFSCCRMTHHERGRLGTAHHISSTARSKAVTAFSDHYKEILSQLQPTMERLWPDLLLPTSPSRRCLDRFSLLDEEGDDGLVMFWPLLEHILGQPVKNTTQLIDVLDTIAHENCGSSGAANDYGTLREAVEQHGDTFFSRLWPTIVQLALMLPNLFPTRKIPVLQPGEKLCLTAKEVSCLVAHQFLCTCQPPPWREGYHDFSVWYGSGQRHPQAVRIYLTALFSYFDEFSGEAAISLDRHVEFSLHVSIAPKLDESRLGTLTVVYVEKFSTEPQEAAYQGHNGATIVSANKDIGFGQSATQEELYVGNCPEACPAVLFTPTLRDDQVLVVRGARPMLRILGQRRDLVWEELAPKEKQGGRMLFMDALELDEVSEGSAVLSDLKRENMTRELRKAYTAFLSWSGGENPVVWTGLWGCGAFNGDPATKAILMWMAASLAGKELRLLVDASQKDFGVRFGRFVEKFGAGLDCEGS